MNTIEIPKIFWKYFDSYRRKQLTLEEFSLATGLSKSLLEIILSEIQQNLQ